MLRILQPFFEITKQVSSEQSSLSDVIPHVVALGRYLSKSGDDSGVQTTKEELRSALRQRLLSPSGEKLNVKEEKNYVVTTVVDSHCKFRFLDDKETAKKWLLDEMQVTVSVAITEQTVVETDQTEENARKAERATETSTKRRTTPNTTKTLKEEIHSDFTKCYEDDHDLSYSFSDDERSRPRHQGPSLAELVKEIDKYAVSPTIERSKDPLIFWKLHYPNLARVARRYLSCPASSVYSERLFSEAGNIYEEHRSRLLPRNGEHLLFLHHNIPRFPKS